MVTEALSGIVLASEERVVSNVSLITSNLTPWVKLNLVLTNRRLAGKNPNFLLGLIPTGSSSVTYPLSNIAGVATNTRISILGLIFGAIFVLVGITDLRAVLSLVIGVVLLLNAFYADIQVTNSGGAKLSHRVSIFNKGAAESFVHEVNTAIAERG